MRMRRWRRTGRAAACARRRDDYCVRAVQRSSERGANSFPRPAGSDPNAYEVWVHCERDGGTDGGPPVVDVTATRTGEEARTR